MKELQRNLKGDDMEEGRVIPLAVLSPAAWLANSRNRKHQVTILNEVTEKIPEEDKSDQGKTALQNERWMQMEEQRYKEMLEKRECDRKVFQKTMQQNMNVMVPAVAKVYLQTRPHINPCTVVCSGGVATVLSISPATLRDREMTLLPQMSLANTVCCWLVDPACRTNLKLCRNSDIFTPTCFLMARLPTSRHWLHPDGMLCLKASGPCGICLISAGPAKRSYSARLTSEDSNGVSIIPPKYLLPKSEPQTI